MIKKINNLFAVNTEDTIGTALVKGATKSYLQGVLAAGLGLGVLAFGVKAFSNKGKSNEEEEELTDESDELSEDVNEMEADVFVEHAKAVLESTELNTI